MAKGILGKGIWKVGIPGTVVADNSEGFPPNTGHSGREAADYYGGNLIAESILTKETAKLIAAAPDLLEACQAVMKSPRGETLVFEVLNKLYVAIEKATK